MYNQQAMLASPMTPVMHHSQQQPQYHSPYHQSPLGQQMSPGPWGNDGQMSTPQHYRMATPQSNARSLAYAASPGSNQPYTCYVCNATATSRKNYIAHLQVTMLLSPAFQQHVQSGACTNASALAKHAHLLWGDVCLELLTFIAPTFWSVMMWDINCIGQQLHQTANRMTVNLWDNGFTECDFA